MTENRATKKIYDRDILLRLASYGKPYWYLIALAIFLIMISMGLEILAPYLTKVAIDKYILSGDFHGLLLIALLYTFVLIGNFLFKYSQIMLTQYIGQKVMLDLRQQIFDHLQTLHQQFFDKNPIGRLMTRVTSDVESLNQVFTQGIVMIFGDILKINAYLQEHISGMSTVQLFNREEKNFEKFKEINWQHTLAYIKTIFYYAIFFPVVELISAIALALIIYRGGAYLLENFVTFGTLIAFIQYAQMFFRPISDLSEKYNILQSAFAASERIFKLLDTPPAILSSPSGYTSPRIEKGIEFRNVSFAYDNELVLKNIDLFIPMGKRYALVGHTGAGKTTLTRLIGRFYDIQEGEILIDGVDVRQWDLADLRRKMAVVQQDIFLFSGTVLDNIRLGDRSISEERVIKAAQMVNAHHFIQKLPGQYHAEIRERGSNLSQGQKQLLAMARAIVFDPEILILDEATANIDSESEYLIQHALKIVMKNRTAIVVAHRLSTIQSVDQIVVLHHGRIREIGTHQELLKKRGLYYRLYQLQYKDQEVLVT